MTAPAANVPEPTPIRGREAAFLSVRDYHCPGCGPTVIVSDCVRVIHEPDCPRGKRLREARAPGRRRS